MIALQNTLLLGAESAVVEEVHSYVTLQPDYKDKAARAETLNGEAAFVKAASLSSCHQAQHGH